MHERPVLGRCDGLPTKCSNIPFRRILPTHKRAAAASDDSKKSAAAAEDEEEVREGVRSMVHFKLSPNRHPLNMRKLDPKEKVWENPTHHSVWTQAEVDGVRITHLAANDVRALQCAHDGCLNASGCTTIS